MRVNIDNIDGNEEAIPAKENGKVTYKINLGFLFFS